MKAAFIRKTGDPEVIEYGDMPDPQPGLSQVLVKVTAVAVNPIDTYIRSGAIALPLEFPYIIGCDLAGVVERVGEEVQRFQPGDRVWCSNQGLFGRAGSFAEYAAVDEDWLYPTPDGLDDESAAGGALVGITAHLGLHLHGRLQPGEIVFVNGGTGGVGSSVIQLAKAAGAKVIATAGSDAKLTRCRQLGADLAVNYRSATLDEEIRSFTESQSEGSNRGVNIWFETQREPTLERTIGLMAKRGRIILMAGRQARPDFPLGTFYVNDLQMCGFAMFNASPQEQRAAADGIHAAVAKGGWQVLVGKTLPLSESAAAHRLQQESTLEQKGELAGKIVLTP